MRLALVICLAPDRRSGRVWGDVVTADVATATVKQALTTNTIPDARYPIMVAVPLDSKLREHRFSPTRDQVAEAEAYYALELEEASQLNGAIAKALQSEKDRDNAISELAEETKAHAAAKLIIADLEKKHGEATKAAKVVEKEMGALKKRIEELTKKPAEQKPAEQKEGAEQQEKPAQEGGQPPP